VAPAAEIPRDVIVPASNDSVRLIGPSKPAKVRHKIGTDVGTAKNCTDRQIDRPSSQSVSQSTIQTMNTSGVFALMSNWSHTHRLHTQ